MPQYPVTRSRIVLQLHTSARFRFLHGGALRGLLSSIFQQHPIPKGILPYACESGKVRYVAGEKYAFGLTCIYKAQDLYQECIDRLKRLGNGTLPASSERPQLGGNFTVEEAPDLAPPDMEKQYSTLGDNDTLTLRFLSPLRIALPTSLQRKGMAFCNQQCFPTDLFLKRVWARLESLHLTPGMHAPDISDAIHISHIQLNWLDLPVPGSKGRNPNRPQGYTLGGVIGHVTIAGLSAEWRNALLLGQHIHIGQRVHYGFGRYAIEECGELQSSFFAPAQTALAQCAQLDTLETAREEVQTASTAAGVDYVEPQDVSFRDLSVLEDELKKQTYTAAPLRGVLFPKDSGGVRPLAIPTARDRIAQRAALHVLAESIDALLEDCSFAYRKGFSRQGAANALSQAYKDGYRYVLDADITMFFDNVDWNRLFAILDGLYPREPLVRILKDWVRAPVEFDGRRIERTQGLPQGTAISPLLANLYLDAFDEALLDQGFRLVRFADDFVVLCKDVEQAKKAQEAAQRELAQLGLQLNEEKTQITSFDAGFTYLGYLFCRSLVLEHKKDKTNTPDKTRSHNSVPPAGSWLAAVPLEKIDALVSRNTHQKDIVRVPLAYRAIGESPARRALYLQRTHTKITLNNESIILSQDDEATERIPMRSLSHVVLLGRGNAATVPLLHALGKAEIPTYICTRTGKLETVHAAANADWTLWMQQAQAMENPQLRLAWAQKCVAAKLHNYATLTTRLKLHHGGDVSQTLRQAQKDVYAQTSLDSVRGIEGRCAAVYFKSLQESVPDDWGFHGRRKNPSPDPINALLSFGYTMLYNHCTTSIHAVGLNPRLGLYHVPHGTFAALAADIQEEFRHMVDGVVIALIRRKEVKPSQFLVEQEGPFRCIIPSTVVRRLILNIEHRLFSLFTPFSGEHRTTYRAFMDTQAYHLVQLIRTQNPDVYSPLQMHS